MWLLFAVVNERELPRRTKLNTIAFRRRSFCDTQVTFESRFFFSAFATLWSTRDNRGSCFGGSNETLDPVNNCVRAGA